MPPPGLRANRLSAFEEVAQTLGMLAAAGNLGILLPLIIGKAGNASWLLFAVVPLIFMLILAGITRFARGTVSAGSLATYSGLGLGRWGSVVTGWSYVLAMLISVAGASACFVCYADPMVGRLLGHGGGPLRFAALFLAANGTAWALTRRDVKLSTEVMLGVEILSLSVAGLLLLLAIVRHGAWIDPAQLTLRGLRPSGLPVALLIAFLTFTGIESATTLSEETRHATRTVPRVILGCLFPVALLYVASTYGLVALAHAGLFGGTLDEGSMPFDALARSLHLPALGILCSLGITLSFFASTVACFNAGARVLYSMAQTGDFWRPFGLAHPRNGTPHRALALYFCIGTGAPLFLLARRVAPAEMVGYFGQMCSLAFIVAYFLVCLATPFYLRRQGRLTSGMVAVTAAALLFLAAFLGLSIFPIPPAPDRYLVYILLALIGAGSALSWKLNPTP